MVRHPFIHSAAPDPSGRASSRMPLPAMPRSRTGRHGYTLLEMLIVLAVLAIMAGLGWPAVQKMARRSRVSDAAKQVRNASRSAAGGDRIGQNPGVPIPARTGRFEIAPKQEENAGPAVLRSALDQMAEAAASAGRPPPIRMPARGPSRRHRLRRAGGRRAAGRGWRRNRAGRRRHSAARRAAGVVRPDRVLPERADIERPHPVDGSDRYFVEISLRGLTGAVRIGPTTQLTKAPQARRRPARGPSRREAAHDMRQPRRILPARGRAGHGRAARLRDRALAHRLRGPFPHGERRPVVHRAIGLPDA